MQAVGSSMMALLEAERGEAEQGEGQRGPWHDVSTEKRRCNGLSVRCLGGLPVGAWRLPPSHWVVGAPKPPPVAPGSARNTRSHDSPLHPVPPRGGGPGARMAPGGPAERAGAQTRRELQLGARAGLPGGQGLRGGEANNGLFSAENILHGGTPVCSGGRTTLGQ